MMPISVLLILIIGISLAAYLYLRPLQFLTNNEWLISHSVLIIALTFVLGSLWLNRDQFTQVTFLMAGIWGFAGGVCFVVVFIVRRLPGSLARGR